MYFLKKLNFWLFAQLTATVLFMSSCSLAPQANYTAMAEQERQQVTAWAAQEGAKQTTSLNELINSPELNALIEEALLANPSLQQTVLTLKILRAQRYQARADRLPEVSLDVATENGEDDLNSYSGSLSISWEIDLWQKLADTESAAGMDEAEQKALLQAARDSLAAEVMQEWLGLIRDLHTIDIERQRLENLEKNERYILQRYRSGIGTLEDLESARTSTAVSRASIEEYKESLAQRQRTLKTLLGRIGTADIAVVKSYPVVITPLADLPEQTLRRRPDLRRLIWLLKQPI